MQDHITSCRRWFAVGCGHASVDRLTRGSELLELVDVRKLRAYTQRNVQDQYDRSRYTDYTPSKHSITPRPPRPVL